MPALREVLDRLGEGETAVVVTHGAALRVGVVGLLGWPTEAATGLAAMDNCGRAVLAESGTGALRLAAYNVTG